MLSTLCTCACIEAASPVILSSKPSPTSVDPDSATNRIEPILSPTSGKPLKPSISSLSNTTLCSSGGKSLKSFELHHYY